MEDITHWDIRFMNLAETVAQWSKDRSRKVGSVIVGQHHEVRSLGWNGFPRNMNDDVEERHQRPLKYSLTVHSEANSIFNATLIGTSLNQCTLYVNWFPCPDCVKAIIQTGIREVVVVEPDFNHPQWGAPYTLSKQMLEEVGIKIKYFPPDKLIHGKLD